MTTLTKARAATEEENRKVADKWSGFATLRETDPRYKRLFAMENPHIEALVNKTYFGGGCSLSLIQKRRPEMRFGRVLEIGCGPGNLSRLFAKNYFCGSIDAFDIAPGNIRLAREKAAGEGIKNINFYLGDANTLKLPAEKYDLILVSHSLHHILNLENLFSQAEQALTPDGLFWADDYCGPNRMQWTAKQLYYINEILSILPDKYKVRNDGLSRKNSAERIPLEAFLRNDPSEGVRALDILPVANNYLDVKETVFWGGSILYELLLYIVHNFDEKDTADRALLELIFFMEQRLIKEGVLESNFVAFTAARFARKESCL